MQNEKLKECILQAHEEFYNIKTNKKAKGYTARARQLMLDKAYPADTYPEQNACLTEILNGDQSIRGRIKSLFGKNKTDGEFLLPSVFQLLSFIASC